MTKKESKKFEEEMNRINNLPEEKFIKLLETELEEDVQLNLYGK